MRFSEINGNGVTDHMRRHGLFAEGEDDSAGAGGSAAVLEDDPDDIAARNGDDPDGEESGEDGQPRGRRALRFRSLEEADEQFRTLQSQKDKAEARANKLSARTERLEREFESLRQRVTTQPGDAVNPLKEQARTKGRQLRERITKLQTEVAQDDPAYAERYWETVAEVMMDGHPQTMEQTARAVAREEQLNKSKLDAAAHEAKQVAIAELKAQGLDETYLDDMYDMVARLEKYQPDWFQKVANEDQISELVTMVKERWAGRVKSNETPNHDSSTQTTTRRRTAGDMNDVIGEGGRPRTGSRQETEIKDPGSILDDLKRLRKHQRATAAEMFRRAN